MVFTEDLWFLSGVTTVLLQNTWQVWCPLYLLRLSIQNLLLRISSNRFPNHPSSLYPILQLGKIAWNFPKIANPSLLDNRWNFVTILHIMMFLLMSMKQLVADYFTDRFPRTRSHVMMWFNKIYQDCHPSTAVGLSRVHMYESKCNLPLQDTYLNSVHIDTTPITFRLKVLHRIAPPI